jgi:uncharacterized protein (TIGR02099 family)
MIKKSLLWVYHTTLWLTGIVTLAILIAVLTVQFYIFPNIDKYKGKIATFASQVAKQKVVIGNIKADWQGINPHLSLSNIDVFDAQNRLALQLKNTDASITWLSILRLEPYLSHLTFYTPELITRRDSTGEIFVAGISMSGQSNAELPNWLLRQHKVEVRNAKVVWLDEMRGAPAISLDHINLEISTPLWRSLIGNHRITISALPSIGTNKPITFNGNIYGDDVSQIEQWRGNITLQLESADVAAFRPWLDYPIDIQSGVGSTKVMVHFANSHAQSISSDVALDNVQIQLKANAKPVVLNKLTGKLNWENLSANQLTDNTQPIANQSFNVEQLTLSTSNGLNLQDASATYTEKVAENAQVTKALNLKLAHIDLAVISSYLDQLPISAEVLQKIASLSPTGGLDDLVIDWEGNQSSTKSYQVSSKFSGLSIQAYNKIPGFSNLTGEINADQSTGQLKLYTENAKLDFKDVLRWPIQAVKLDGAVSWDINDKETIIKVSQLNISNPHLSGTINANYLMDGNKGGYLDLNGKFGKGNAKYALFYYPIMLGETTLHWLDTSILSGQVEDVNLTVKGRLADFPFVDSKNNLDSKLGLFRVTAKISNCLLEYGTGWPTINGLGADLLFEGKRMEINANAGRVLGNQMINSKTTIAQLDADYPILNIVSDIKGPVAEGIKFVNNSPVAEAAQGFTEDLKTSGSGKLNLSLKIPMQNLDAAQYKGLYQITNGSMEGPSIPTLTGINGALAFTENSLTAKKISASAFSAPLVFDLNSGKDKIIRIAAKGQLTNEAIQQIFISQNLNNAENYLSGNTSWVGNITIQKPRVNISIRTDLFGLTSHLPIPLNKSANDHLNLRIDTKQDIGSDTVTLNIDNILGAKIIRTVENGKLQLDQASINVNSASANNSTNTTGELNTANEAGKTKGLQVTGNLDYLDADAWLFAIDDLFDTAKQKAAMPTLPIQKIDLKINKLDLIDRRINQLRIQNKAVQSGLQVSVQSREITGDIQWLSQKNGKLVARLSNVITPDKSPERLKSAIQPNKKNSSAKNGVKLEEVYPAVDIIADSFEFDKQKIGRLELISLPQNGKMIIQTLKLINPESTLTAHGETANAMQNPHTQLNVTWNIKDLGQTLQRFGYPDTIKGGEGELSGQLNWAGKSTDFDIIALNGNLQFDVRKGQILKMQPGVGRLLGLLSLQSLPRRLTLDFSDLFSSGFSFDKIAATVNIDKGVMRSNNFMMSGPVADVKMKGETNLQKETQQLYIKVIPNVSDSVSLAALAGGPLAGAVAFLAQKILKDPLGKITSSEYEITGTWNNPQEDKTSNSNKENNQEINKASPLNQQP